jgi:CHAT domain-containing protein
MKKTILQILFSCLIINILAAQSKADSLGQVFKMLYAANDFKAAIPTGEKWWEAVGKEGIPAADTARFGRRLTSLANCCLVSQEHEKCERFAQIAMRILPPDSVDYETPWVVLANLRMQQGQYTSADSLLQSALASYQAHHRENKLSYNNALRVLGDVRYMQGLVPEAEATYRLALSHWEANGFKLSQNLGAIYGGLSLTAGAQGNVSQERFWLEKCIEIFTGLYPNDSPMVLGRKIVYASLLIDNQLLKEAESVLSETLSLLETSEQAQSLQQAYALDAWATLSQKLGKTEAALATLLQAAAIYQQQLGGSHPSTLSNLKNQALLLLELDRKLEARQLAQALLDTLATSPEQHDRELADAHSLLADCSESPAEAIAQRRLALQYAHASSGQSEGGDQAEITLNLLYDYLKIKDLENAATILGLFGDYASKAAPHSSDYLGYLRRSAQFHLLQSQPENAFNDWVALANSHRQMVAEDLFLLNDLQRLDRMKQLKNVADWWLTQCQQSGIKQAEILPQTLDFQLFTKSILLSASQKIRENIEAAPALAPIFADWTDARERLAWAYTQPKDELAEQKISVPALEAKADSLEQAIARQSADFAAASLRRPFTWQDVKQRLQPGEAALEIARFNAYSIVPTDSVRYAFFIVKPDSPQPVAVFMEDAERFEQVLVEQYLTECANTKGKGVTAALYDAFWKKLEPELKGIHRLYVSNDGAFHKINLAAIQMPGGSYVADQLEVLPVFNLKAIGGGRQTMDGGRDAVLMGSPQFLLSNEGETAMRSVTETVDSSLVAGETRELRGLKLAPLPGSQQEVADLSGLLQRNGWETTLRTGEAADEAAVKSVKSPRLLHLATHGYFLANERSGTAGLSRGEVERNPMLRSMLFFAGAQNTLDGQALPQNLPTATPNPQLDDGILTAYEVQNLDLKNTELVVLSACQTARGKVQNGEGVYGLQRALRIAGASSLLLTLWDVDDRVGQAFMRHFYEKWLGGSTKAEAFRWAQQQVRSQWPQPFYWAGFVLVE